MEIAVEDFLTDWLHTIASNRSKNTHRFYKWLVNKRILPRLGKIKLADLTPTSLQSYYGYMREQGSSAHQVHCIHKVLRASMNDALKLGHIGRNPCSGTIPPKPNQAEMQFYDEKQAKGFLETALALGDRFYVLYYLAIHTGMRQAELMGLRWEDVSWERRTIKVKRQVLHIKGGGFTFTTPKSRSGKRTIILGRKAMDFLEAQRGEARKAKEEAGEDWKDLDLIFPSEVGTPVTASNLRRSFRKLIAVSGLPKVRFHDLRHTAATLMLNHGIPVLIVSRRLGHSKPSITLDIYGPCYRASKRKHLSFWTS